MKYLIWIGIAGLLLLHQDFWFWDDASLWFGFMPVGMAYHVGISLAAAILWWLATKFCWPEGAEPGSSSDEGGRRS